MNVNRSAPVGSVDMAAFKDDGTPYEIWPCLECLPWHAFDCPCLQELMTND